MELLTPSAVDFKELDRTKESISVHVMKFVMWHHHYEKCKTGKKKRIVIAFFKENTISIKYTCMKHHIQTVLP